MKRWFAGKFLDSRSRESLLIVLFFIIVAALSLYSFEDFGIYTDQHNNPRHLCVTLKKYFSVLGITEKAPQKVQEAEEFDDYQFKYYGVVQQYPLLFLEYFAETFKIPGVKYWQLRHLYVRAIFILAGVFFYFILKQLTKNKMIILLGLLLFFLHPRISAHSFYNMKDSIFLSFFTLAIYFLLNAIKNPSKFNIVSLSIMSAITTNVRMMGVIIPLYFGLWMLWEYKKSLKTGLKKLLVFIAGFSLTSFLIWPLLWNSPIDTFLKAFIHFSNYTAWKGTNIYNGQLVPGDNLPISYVPVWIAISSPYAHLIIFIIGLVFSTYWCCKKDKLTKENRQCAMACLFFVFVSYLAIIVFKSTLYGDWRHLYYLFTPLLLLGLIGLNYISIKYQKIFTALICIVFLSLLTTMSWMVINHPHHYVYFNAFAGKDWNKKWDGDTWNLATKQLLDKVLEKDLVNGKKLKILGNHAVNTNLFVIPIDFRKRVKVVDDIKDADYILGNHRNIIGDYPKNYFDGFSEYLSITVDGNKIKTLFKREEGTRN